MRNDVTHAKAASESNMQFKKFDFLSCVKKRKTKRASDDETQNPEATPNIKAPQKP